MDYTRRACENHAGKKMIELLISSIKILIQFTLLNMIMLMMLLCSINSLKFVSNIRNLCSSKHTATRNSTRKR